MCFSFRVLVWKLFSLVELVTRNFFLISAAWHILVFFHLCHCIFRIVAVTIIKLEGERIILNLMMLIFHRFLKTFEANRYFQASPTYTLFSSFSSWKILTRSSFYSSFGNPFFWWNFISRELQIIDYLSGINRY